MRSGAKTNLDQTRLPLWKLTCVGNETFWKVNGNTKLQHTTKPNKSQDAARTKQTERTHCFGIRASSQAYDKKTHGSLVSVSRVSGVAKQFSPVVRGLPKLSISLCPRNENGATGCPEDGGWGRKGRQSTQQTARQEPSYLAPEIYLDN